MWKGIFNLLFLFWLLLSYTIDTYFFIFYLTIYLTAYEYKKSNQVFFKKSFDLSAMQNVASFWFDDDDDDDTSSSNNKRISQILLDSKMLSLPSQTFNAGAF